MYSFGTVVSEMAHLSLQQALNAVILLQGGTNCICCFCNCRPLMMLGHATFKLKATLSLLFSRCDWFWFAWMDRSEAVSCQHKHHTSHLLHLECSLLQTMLMTSAIHGFGSNLGLDTALLASGEIIAAYPQTEQLHCLADPEKLQCQVTETVPSVWEGVRHCERLWVLQHQSCLQVHSFKLSLATCNFTLDSSIVTEASHVPTVAYWWILHSSSCVPVIRWLSDSCNPFHMHWLFCANFLVGTWACPTWWLSMLVTNAEKTIRLRTPWPTMR